MNGLRCFVFAAIVVIASATFALGGDMQTPAKSEPTPTPTPTAVTTDGPTQPTSTEELVWHDATTILVELLLTIF